jgi:hypothetical protein
MLDEAKGIAVPPGDGNRFVEDSGGEDDGQMGAAMEAHADFAIADRDVGRHVDEVVEDQAGLGLVVREMARQSRRWPPRRARK